MSFLQKKYVRFKENIYFLKNVTAKLDIIPWKLPKVVENNLLIYIKFVEKLKWWLASLILIIWYNLAHLGSWHFNRAILCGILLVQPAYFFVHD